MESHLWAVQSQSELADGSDEAYGIQVIYPNEPWDLYFYTGQYGERYDPSRVWSAELRLRLGAFLHGKRDDYRVSLSWRPRPAFNTQSSY